MLIPVQQLDESVKRYEVLKEKPVRKELAKKQTEKKLVEAAGKNITEEVAKGNLLGDKVNLDKRREMLEKMSLEPPAFAFERAIGENDSVYSNFADLIGYTKEKVARIVIRQGAKKLGYATGFMVSNRLLLTNWHVFKTKESVAQSEAEFYYEYDIFGRTARPVVFQLKPEDFFYSFKDLDYCFIAVEPVDVTGRIPLSSIGYIYLDPSLGKLGNEKQELLNIIHHPGGDYKQLSIRKNEFTKIMATTIWYKSDTAQGSSGSPVFNDQWQIVALHHMGVPSTSRDGQFLDKNKNPVPVVNGEVDETKIHWIANEGIRISVILKDIFSKYARSPFIDGLKLSPGARTGSPDTEAVPEKQPIFPDTGSRPAANMISFSLPASLMERTGQVEVVISNHATKEPAVGIKPDAQDSETGLLEISKVDREEGMDFSDCKGYQPNFMGVEIKLPKPKSSLLKQLAKTADGKTELKYFHYSILFNQKTKLPALSAINVEGDPEKRLDNSKRSDNWLRDKRIPREMQLTDNYYELSGFDKGHMGRFEDANWADTEEEALRNGIYTCFYTNACPQVPGLNRGGGVWGKLEKAVLELGVKKEEGKLGRISVFNGPIFSRNHDRVFRGNKVPMDFFKIIVWRNDDGQLKATGFRLSQTDLVKSINFNEVAGITLEAIDIDTNEKFLEYQASIPSLSKATGLDFSGLNKYDTFNSSTGAEEMLINNASEVDLLISSNRRRT